MEIIHKGRKIKINVIHRANSTDWVAMYTVWPTSDESGVSVHPADVPVRNVQSEEEAYNLASVSVKKLIDDKLI